MPRERRRAAGANFSPKMKLMKQTNRRQCIVTMKRTTLLVALLVAGTMRTTAADVMTPVDLRQVKVGGELGRRIEITVANNLLQLDLEKDFLAPLRVKKPVAGGYIGLGKLIESTARLALYTGNETLLARKKRLVDEILKTQEPDGYIGAFKPEQHLWGGWDACEAGYLILGFVTDHRLFGEQRSLEAARRLADHLIAQWPTKPEDWAGKVRVAEDVMLTGLDRAILALHTATGNRRYLGFFQRQLKAADWNREIEIGRRLLIGGHTYAYYSHCMAQLELHRMQPATKLLRATERAMDFMVAKNGLTITGGLGQWECWSDDQDGRRGLAETCSTTYQLFVYDSLLQLRGESLWGDLIERTLYNTAFGAQSPDGRRLRYYTPLEGPREYYPHDSMCCPSNYRRIIAALPQLIYYRSDSGVAVSLYTASQATIDLGQSVTVALRQETDYPTSGRVTLHVDPSKPASFPLQLRIPRWCAKPAVTINGQPTAASVKSGSFLSIEREWQAGDRVALDLPMEWRLVAGRQRQAGRVAVMRGPVVYTLDPSQEKKLVSMDATDLGGLVLIASSIEPVVANDSVRPGGTACRLKFQRAGFGMGDRGELALTLTEFPDPNGHCIYFSVPDLSVAVPDELYQPSR